VVRGPSDQVDRSGSLIVQIEALNKFKSGSMGLKVLGIQVGIISEVGLQRRPAGLDLRGTSRSLQQSSGERKVLVRRRVIPGAGDPSVWS
jgi:hypothetical protein